MKVKTYYSILKWHIRDRLIFGSRKQISFLVLISYLILNFLGFKDASYKFLLFSNRLGSLRLSQKLIKKNLTNLVNYANRVILHANTDNSEHWIKSRCTILSLPQAGIKGVLVINFSTTFIDVLKLLDCEKLLKDYWIILEPSWAGYALPEIFAWMKYDQKILVQASEKADRDLLKYLNTNLIPVSFGASDWVDHEIFFKTGDIDNKIYDAIYVANYNSIKRHYVFLKAIKIIQRYIPEYRAALVCGEWGDSKEEILDIIYSLSLNKVIDIYEEISQRELNKLLNKSKVNLLLSLKEGSNRSLFEGMFAGTPAIVLKNNIGVNKEYFTIETGLAIDEYKLVDALEYFYFQWKEFKPREWAVNNIAPEKTTKKLEENLKAISRLDYELPVKVNQPESIIKDPAQRINISDDFIIKYSRG